MKLCTYCQKSAHDVVALKLVVEPCSDESKVLLSVTKGPPSRNILDAPHPQKPYTPACLDHVVLLFRALDGGDAGAEACRTLYTDLNEKIRVLCAELAR